jgi:hypothetical protein
LLGEFKIVDKNMKGSICIPLSTVGTLKSIPVLKEAYKRTRDGFWESHRCIKIGNYAVAIKAI